MSLVLTIKYLEKENGEYQDFIQSLRFPKFSLSRTIALLEEIKRMNVSKKSDFKGLSTVILKKAFYHMQVQNDSSPLIPGHSFEVSTTKDFSKVAAYKSDIAIVIDFSNDKSIMVRGISGDSQVFALSDKGIQSAIKALALR